jgi:hypothetical protein
MVWFLAGARHFIVFRVSRAYLGVKQLGHEAAHRPAEIENAWFYTATVTYVFQVWCLIKHGDVTFTIITVCKHCPRAGNYTNCRFTCSCCIPCVYILIKHRWCVHKFKFVVVMAQLLRQLVMFKEEHGSDFLLHDVHSTTLSWSS